MEKLCIACQTTKSIDEFHVDRSRPDGHYPYCKPCMRAKVKMYSKRAPRIATPEGTRHCQYCKETKPLTEFYTDKKMADGYSKRCKACAKRMVNEWRSNHVEEHRARVKEWRDANPEKHADMSARWRYGLPMGTYAKMLAAQDEKCAICRTDTPGGNAIRRFHVDHCHETGTIRGLLCTSCNNGLGRFQHREDLLQAAIRYLEVYPTTRS